MRTRFSQYLVMVVHDPASFWQENMIAIIILPQFLARIYGRGGNKSSNVRGFIILPSGEGLTSPSIKMKVLTFLVKSTMKLSRMSIFLEYEKKLEVKSCSGSCSHS